MISFIFVKIALAAKGKKDQFKGHLERHPYRDSGGFGSS